MWRPERIALRDEECDQHGRRHQDKRREPEDDRLAPEHRQAPRDSGHRGANHPGRVLGGDHEHAEHADRELGDLDADEADLERVEVSPVARAGMCGQWCETTAAAIAANADREHERRGQRPLRRAHRAELRPARRAKTRSCVTRPVCSSGGTTSAGRACSRGGLLAVLPSRGEPNSTAARVSVMNASSSEACCGVSSWIAIPCAAAASPICSAVSPCTSRRPRSPPSKVTPGAFEQRAQALAARASGRSTTLAEARATNSSTLVSAISLPRPITIRWSAVSAISLIRCEETKTVRPSAASALEQVADPVDPLGVEPVDRLVEHQRRRVAEQRRRDPEPLAHAERELAGALAARRRAGRRGRSARGRGASGSRGSAPARAGGCRPSARCARSAPRAARRPRAAAPRARGSACR